MVVVVGAWVGKGGLRANADGAAVRSIQNHASDPIDEEELCKLINALQPNDEGLINYEDRIGMYVTESKKD